MIDIENITSLSSSPPSSSPSSPLLLYNLLQNNTNQDTIHQTTTTTVTPDSYHLVVKNIFLWKKISYYLKSSNVTQKCLRFSFNHNSNNNNKKQYTDTKYQWKKYDDIKSVRRMIESNNIALLKDKLKNQKELQVSQQDTRLWVRYLDFDLFVTMFYRYREMVESRCFIIDLAAESRDLEKVKMLHNVDIKMRRGTNFNVTYASKTAMDISARYGELDIVKFLNENRYEDCSENAIDISAFHGHLSVVKYLFSFNKPYTNRAIEGAAEQGHRAVVEFLVANQNPPQFRAFVIDTVKAKGYNDIAHILEKSVKQQQSNSTSSANRMFSNWFIKSN
ncbi:hypothetical protein CYY_005175 [Polysphondylium violaceum]|uniref:Ankyrin repeat-containing protein n=1 Tax=Polysphondylium violaceum TaxID=133409 RepID=A0A8J4Q3X8_9MYCE|nr:hypothetical protein CYY_005175 [Polysphondylium violaceum]